MNELVFLEELIAAGFFQIVKVETLINPCRCSEWKFEIETSHAG